jgi:hypothetical protein
MSAPANTSALTAIEVSALPYAATQNVNDGGTTYTVWYRYTVTAADVMAGVIGVWGFGALGGYQPSLLVHNGTAAAPVSTGISGVNVPVEVPVTTVGETFFFKFIALTNYGTANLAVSVLRAPTKAVPVGAVGINDATAGFPLVFIDADTGEVLRFKNNVPAGESLWVLPTGELLVEDLTSSPNSVKLFNGSIALIASPSVPSVGTAQTVYINGDVAGTTFYVGRPGSVGFNAKVFTVSKTGVVGATSWDLGAVGLHALAPSPDETILYFCGGPAVTNKIQRYDLVNSVLLSDLAATQVGFVTGDDLIVLPDGSILAFYNGSGVYHVTRYSAAGATLNTYAISAHIEALYPTSVDGSSFGVWFQEGTGQYSEFETIRVSDGALIRTTGQTQKYNDGEYQGNATATPLRWGSSFSCQPFMQRTAVSTTQPIPVKPSAAPRTPCEPQTETGNGDKGKAGCNTGGVGFIPPTLVDYGEVPQHDDPIDGEQLTGKDLLGIGFWIEIHHVDYPTEDVTIYRRALGPEIADLADYEGGRKSEGVLAIGDVEHGLGNEQGDDEAATIDIEYSDIVDRLFRNLLENQELEGDEVYIKAASRQAREGSPTQLPRTLLRGVIQRASPTSGLRVAISAVDPIFSESGAYGPGETWPGAVPNTLGWRNDGLTWPVLYGVKSDEGATDPITNAPNSKGLIPLWYVGQQRLSDLGGTSPDPPVIVPDAGIDAPAIVQVTNAANNIPEGSGWTVRTYMYIAAVIGGQVGTISAQSTVGAHGNPEGAGVAIHFNELDGGADSYIAWVSDDPLYHPVTNPTVGRIGVATHYGQGATDFWFPQGLETVEGDPDSKVYADFTVLITANQPNFGEGIWDAYLVVLGASTRMISLFGSDLGGGNETKTHDRVRLLMSEHNGSDILSAWDDDGNIDPNWTAAGFSDPFIDYTDPVTGKSYTCTMVFARGPISDDHKNGIVNMACNLVGRPEFGTSGRPLVHVMRVEQAWIENDILLDYTSGVFCTNLTAPMWRDGVYKVRSSSFAERDAFLIASVGGIGLRSGWYVPNGGAKPVTEWIREWNRSTETKLGRNGHGQIVVSGLDETETITDWPTIRHVSDVFGPITRVQGEERENAVAGACDWDDDAEKYRVGPFTTRDEAAIRKYSKSATVDRVKMGEPVDSTILNYAEDLLWVHRRRLARLREGMALVNLTGSLGFLDTDVGHGIRLHSREGLGPNGYVAHPFIIMRRRISCGERLVTYTLWDVKNTLIETAFENGLDRIMYETDDDDVAFLETDDDALAPLEVL